jgi:hypothetical protein
MKIKIVFNLLTESKIRKVKIGKINAKKYVKNANQVII